ncbi:MAG: hypothetical protein E7547_01430 [Ruminococcaceae bacterium]|nr:hypothetical protein [Oscillospiraceae bacterium]
MFIIRKIWSILTLPLLIITLLTSPVAKTTESAELVSKDVFVFEKALLMGQGIATDGEYYYTSGAITALNLTALAKFTFEDMEMVDSHVNPLPDKCTDRGNDHIGGISVYNGKIYASVEDSDEYIYPCIVVFDCETLEPTGEIYDLPKEIFDDGVPWCAVDSETGFLYASKWTDIEKIYVYDTKDSMKFVKEISLNGISPIHRIQGGEFCNGTLYLSNDIEDNGNYKNILSVDVETGKVEIAALRDVGGDNVEAEGLTFWPSEDGAIMHVLDYNKVIGVFVHHYKVDFAEK